MPISPQPEADKNCTSNQMLHTLNLKYLKKTLGKNRPELVDHIEQWVKADKKRKKQLEKNYSLILEAVEDFYNKK